MIHRAKHEMAFRLRACAASLNVTSVILSALILAAFASPARADGDATTPGRFETDYGLFAAVVEGTHVGSDNPVPVSGVVPGAALEATQFVDRFRLHLEGIPTVGATGDNSGAFGRSSASLALLNSVVSYDLDANRRVRVGVGYQFIDLTNLNGTNGDRNLVRIASPIYAAGSDLPVGRNGFVELNGMVDPNLRGTLLVFNYLGRSHPNKPEAGAEVDYSAAYGVRRGNVEYLLGARGLSYHTRDTQFGYLVDRNTGGGVSLEVRFLRGR